MPNSYAVFKTLRQDVLGNHRWDERTRTYATVPVKDVEAVEDAMAAVLERVARVVDWPRLLLEATDRHATLHPEMKATIRDWAPEIGLCRGCMVEALLSDQTGATNWLRHPTTAKVRDLVDWPTVVATRIGYREAASWHPYQGAAG